MFACSSSQAVADVEWAGGADTLMEFRNTVLETRPVAEPSARSLAGPSTAPIVPSYVQMEPMSYDMGGGFQDQVAQSSFGQVGQVGHILSQVGQQAGQQPDFGDFQFGYVK